MKVLWPDNNWDDFFWHDWPTSPAFMVFDDEEPEGIKSSLLGPDGQPIIYDYASDKQGFIGFVPPEVLQALSRPKRRRRRKCS